MNDRLLLAAASWVVLALLGGATAPHPPAGPAGPPLEAWRFNARERSVRGLEQLATDPKTPADSFATAARLEPANARTQLKAGAGWMLAGEPQNGVSALELAARLAGDSAQGAAIAAEAQYQLGTAKLAAGDLEGSIEALRESLRRDPSAEDAKHNLELALRQKEKQDEEKRQQEQKQQQQQQQQEQQQQQQKQEPDPQQPQQQPQPTPQEQNGDQPEQPQTTPSQPRPGEPKDAIEDWKPQPGMTKAQAEALLESVENRERQQRSEEAKKRALKRSREEKDW